MADKNNKALIWGLVLVLGLIVFGCKSAPPPIEPEEEEEEIVEIEEKLDITGTWFSGDHRIRVIYQYRSDGTGCEIIINQGSSYSLTYRPFNYLLTDSNISISFTDSMRPPSVIFNYDMISLTRIRKIDYAPGLSPAFLKQEVTELEGVWRRENSDNIEYIFGARNFLLKLQNGIPTATGNFILSESSLILNDLHRCTDYYMLRWVASTASHENYSYRLADNQLLLSSSGRDLAFRR